MLAVGGANYALAARQAIASVLEQTDFPIYLFCDLLGADLIPHSPRVDIRQVNFSRTFRADGFLAKFEAWRWTLAESGADLILHLDADAVVRRPLLAEQIESALGPHGLGMVEQTTITGSTMGRPEFLTHYIEHALAYLAPTEIPPREDDFRYFNSGVVFFRRDELQAFLAWAEARRQSLPKHHEVGIHMILDQDYLQVWANTIRPGCCAELAWSWNHCEHWDSGFPREAAIVHLSNFCHGPTLASVAQLGRLRRTARRTENATPGDLTFIIVTHNSAKCLAHCLDAVEEAGGAVILVDNASTDDTLQLAFRPGVEVMRNATNEGFAAAANRGAAAARSKNLCFLNPDCVVSAEVVASAIAQLQSDPLSLAVPDYIDWNGKRVAGRQPGYSRWKLMADIAEMQGRPKVVQRLRSIRG